MSQRNRVASLSSPSPTISPKEPAAVWLPIDELRLWDKNPRKNKAAVGAVADSIARFGFGAPLLARAEDKQLIAGHTRLLAAKSIGLTEVPVRLLDLNVEDATLLALADNKLGEIAEWDELQLAKLLEELKLQDTDLAATGFGQDEIDRLLAELKGSTYADIVEDTVPEPPKHPDSRSGQVYTLGDHRLVCGDSTEQDVLKEILSERVADLLFTDPPYGVAYQSNMAAKGTAPRFRKIENDDLSPERLREFLRKALVVAAHALRPGAAIYVCHANQRSGLYAAFESALLSTGFHIGGCLVWVKPAATMGWQDYRNRYEPSVPPRSIRA